MRPGVLQHQNILGVDVELGIIATRRKIFQRVKYPRPALVLEKIGVRSRALEDGTLWRQVSKQRDQAAFFLQRFAALGNDAAVDPATVLVCEALTKCLACDG